MRRGSLFAPILLIGLGAMFLARNLYPDLRLMDYLAKFWPLLLVLWGVLRTAEVLFWASTKQPLPASGVTPGEWLFVILLCFFGTTLHAVRGFSGWFPGTFELGGLDVFGETYDYPFTAAKASGTAPHIVIESFRGDARIVGTDTSEVKVSGRKTIRSIDREGADKADRETPLEVTGDSGTIIIRTNQNRASGLPRVTADMDIEVPKGASLEAHGRNGDFDIQGLAGAVAITAQSAGVRLSDVGGPVRLDLTPSRSVRAVNLKGTLELNGGGSDIDLENIGGRVTVNGPYTGNIEFHNLAGIHFKGPQTEFSAEGVPGDVRMPLRNFNASNLVGPVHIETRMRDVQISGFTNTMDANVDNGDIELRPALPLARMDVHTRSGNITLALPKDAKLALAASTGMGGIVNQFDPQWSLQEARRNTTLHGSSGGPSVTVRTDRGDITVREASPNEPPFEPRYEPKVLPKQLKGLKGFGKQIEQ